jgi:hypothetical protein
MAQGGVLVHNAAPDGNCGVFQSRHFSESGLGRALHDAAPSFRNAVRVGPKRNVVTVDATVNGARKTLRFKNDPGGMHSVQRFVATHDLMTKRGKSIQVHGIYSERPLCGDLSANCRALLGSYFDEYLSVWH